MYFRTKQKRIESKLAKYRDHASTCVQEMARSLERYLESEDLGRLEEDCVVIHRAESKADDIRREIEDMMYERALFPESRGDVLLMLELVEEVPNLADHTARDVVDASLAIPKELHAELRQLLDVSCRCVDDMFVATAKLFTDFTGANAMTGKVDVLESEADDLEHRLIRRVFSGPSSDFEKILLRDLIRDISGLCDSSMKVADRIRVFVARRRL